MAIAARLRQFGQYADTLCALGVDRRKAGQVVPEDGVDGEVLLGEVEEIGDGQARPARDEMDHAVMRPPEAELGQDPVGIADPRLTAGGLDRGRELRPARHEADGVATRDQAARQRALADAGICLKLDFILNHASVLSPQFQDLLAKGERSAYARFFVDWNEFWAGHGEMTQEGYIQPDPALIADMFFRKPGLPLLMVRLPDGSEKPFWNTFYQEVRYPRVDAQDLMAAGLQYASADELATRVNATIADGGRPGNADFTGFEAWRDAVVDLARAGLGSGAVAADRVEASGGAVPIDPKGKDWADFAEAIQTSKPSEMLKLEHDNDLQWLMSSSLATAEEKPVARARSAAAVRGKVSELAVFERCSYLAVHYLLPIPCDCAERYAENTHAQRQHEQADARHLGRSGGPPRQRGRRARAPGARLDRQGAR